MTSLWKILHCSSRGACLPSRTGKRRTEAPCEQPANRRASPCHHRAHLSDYNQCWRQPSMDQCSSTNWATLARKRKHHPLSRARTDGRRDLWLHSHETLKGLNASDNTLHSGGALRRKLAETSHWFRDLLREERLEFSIVVLRPQSEMGQMVANWLNVSFEVALHFLAVRMGEMGHLTTLWTGIHGFPVCLSLSKRSITRSSDSPPWWPVQTPHVRRPWSPQIKTTSDFASLLSLLVTLSDQAVTTPSKSLQSNIDDGSRKTKYLNQILKCTVWKSISIFIHT